MARLFIALVPPRQAIEALEPAVAEVRDNALRWLPSTRWHLTVEYIGNGDAATVAREWAGRARAAPAMKLRLHGAGAFPNIHRARVLWVGLTGDIVAWHRLAGDEQQPHLTIARSRQPVDMTTAVIGLANNDGPAWVADEAVLFDSRPGGADDGGSVYTVIERFALAG